MGILGEKNGMLPLKHLINLEAKSSSSYFLQELVDWELILLQQMLSFSMIVTVDLQAQDRAHRIGQKKEVQVFRFCNEFAIEEKVIERAYKKLALDALVIQQGRLAEQKTVNKDELLQMVRFGAEMVFSSKDSTITDEDIDRIIAKGEEATVELDVKMKKFTEDAIKFKMDDSMLIPF
ncbi:ISWI chromatin-remodeling complex ATPase CHR11-like isoform X2 [Zingiber officinale]|uniref:ISWI chromatin-remodeling complex ATPase CHR11-like isoform X2 n=1 Tax=Zingiber officinale TaxID=94328 RepID=UPI001C4B8DC4|nr:ISWI chromatin-remodeling complex ATPase CHR11-like isoform X2 [Zingiber officinale]